LKEASLVNERRDGVRRLYSVNTDGLVDVRRFVEQFWMVGLTRLKEAAEDAEQRRRDDDER
jgi:hypothetical protein